MKRQNVIRKGRRIHSGNPRRNGLVVEEYVTAKKEYKQMIMSPNDGMILSPLNSAQFLADTFYPYDCHKSDS